MPISIIQIIAGMAIAYALYRVGFAAGESHARVNQLFAPLDRRLAEIGRKQKFSKAIRAELAKINAFKGKVNGPE